MKLHSTYKTCLVAVALLLNSGCAQQQGAPAMPKRIVDLSPTISEDLPMRTVGSKFPADFLTAEQKRDIFYNNAARFLRLDQKEQ
jgi:hypothetical protein